MMVSIQLFLWLFMACPTFAEQILAVQSLKYAPTTKAKADGSSALLRQLKNLGNAISYSNNQTCSKHQRNEKKEVSRANPWRVKTTDALVMVQDFSHHFTEADSVQGEACGDQ